jgi:RNA polymerase sigma-70 factor (ECF subfamily)
MGYYKREEAWKMNGQAIGIRQPLPPLFTDSIEQAVIRLRQLVSRVADGSRSEVSQEVTSEDRADIQASLDGDEQAFARLVRRYENQVAAQMWRFTRDPTLLEELVQDVFVQAYLSLRSFKGRAPFLHWIRRIATRVGYRYWKIRDRDEARLAALSDLHIETLQTPERQSPSKAAELLHTILAQLPPKDRLVLTLMYFEDLSTQEIADRTGWTLTVVKVRAHRARQKMKKLLARAGLGSNPNE